MQLRGYLDRAFINWPGGCAVFILLSFNCAESVRAAVLPQRNAATIEGYVRTDRPGVTPPPRTVQILIPGTNKVVRSVETQGADGYYKIAGIIPGDYDLLAHNRRSYLKDFKPKVPINIGTNKI